MGARTFIVRSAAAPGATAVEARSDRTFQRHTHDDYGIGVVTAGAQRSWSGRGMVEARAGDLITVNPGEVHDGAPIGPERSWSMLYLPPATIGAMVADIREGGPAAREWSAPVVRNARARQLFTRGFSALTMTHGDPEPDDAPLILLLGFLLGGGSPRPVETPRAVRAARERIDDDPAAQHRLGDLAHLAGTSRFGTIRSFLRLTGLTPHAYVVQRRLDLARRLIRGGARLADAALDAGFADQSHFHRAFAVRYGFTPGAYAAAVAPRSRTFVQERRPDLP